MTRAANDADVPADTADFFIDTAPVGDVLLAIRLVAAKDRVVGQRRCVERSVSRPAARLLRATGRCDARSRDVEKNSREHGVSLQ